MEREKRWGMERGGMEGESGFVGRWRKRWKDRRDGERKREEASEGEANGGGMGREESWVERGRADGVKG